MKKTSRESNVEGRIVNVSSEGHRFAYKEGIRFAKLNDEEEYSTIAAYGQSKLANILHANELARRFKEEGVNITANSLHPGAIITNLLRHHSIIDALHRTLGKLVLKNAKQRGLRRSATWRCTRTPRGCRASTGATATCTSRATRPRTRSWGRSCGTTPSTSSQPEGCHVWFG
ncbi:unnamed protein product [Triticum turgidum subsp. durum]|uniref:Short-chain dehydrogenase TIC 32, chloroplastic n=1 Tax=Triticum turgidum subsp. durum TaxID=4567 RepID=A0A9R0W6I6_TRITD|nr:unnamed protein product [Triticum turgidum subsp. durum]